MTSQRVQATIKYLGACDGKPIFYGRQRALDNLPLAEHTVTVEDLRGREAPTLDREGFTLVAHPIGRRNPADPGARAAYRRGIERLVMRLTGATRAVAFTNGVVRRSERSPGFGRDGTTVLGRFAHCDFSPNPAGSQVWIPTLLTPAETEAVAGGRFAIYNVWRVLSPPPQDTPLALCDARTVGAGDEVHAECVVDAADAPEVRFENSVFRYGAGHRWCYFSGMTRDEALIFKGFDSDRTRATGVPHVAFDDPSCPADAPPRESIDDRVLAFFESESS